jgi:hypothetical protein
LAKEEQQEEARKIDLSVHSHAESRKTELSAQSKAETGKPELSALAVKGKQVNVKEERKKNEKDEKKNTKSEEKELDVVKEDKEKALKLNKGEEKGARRVKVRRRARLPRKSYGADDYSPPPKHKARYFEVHRRLARS